jgi:hypothetical protein
MMFAPAMSGAVPLLLPAPLRRVLKDHVTDDARQQLAARVVEHLEQSGFEIDEADQVMRKRPPPHDHG